VFSKRLNIEYEPNELALMYNLKKKHGERIFDLTSSNPTKLNFKYDTKYILKHFIDERSLVYEPEPKGMLTAREEVSKYYACAGKNVSVDDLFIVPSTSEAYSYLFKLLLDAEDEVLMPQPSYPLFEYLTKLDLGNVVYYPMVYDYRKGWSPDFAMLEKKINQRTKAIVIINPNNPTGTYIKENDYITFVKLSEKYNVALIVDEVFSDYEIEPGENILKTVAGYDTNLTFVLNGFSKMLALPQMKFGWILIEGKQKLKEESVKRLEVIADTYLSVATPIQYSAKRLFETREKIQNEILGRIKDNYKLLKTKFLLNPDIKVLSIEGGWNAVLNFENMLIPEDVFVLKLLDEKNVLIHPGYYYDFFTDGFAVVSLLTETDVMEKAIDLING